MSSNYTESMSLEAINKGAIKELFDREYKKLLNNLADENTSWKTQREITIKLKVKLLSEARDSATSMVDVTLKEAPPKPNEQIVQLEFNGKDVVAYAKAEEVQPDLENVHEFTKEA